MPLAWDGASASYYLNDWEPITDFTVWSPQIEAMNWVFMKDEAFRLNPDFWFELSVWDGNQPHNPKADKRLFFKRLGRDYTPERYAAFVKFGMWLLRPRVVRDFRYLEDFHEIEPYVMALADSVDEIHEDPILRQFWRQGRLVENMASKHPYQASIPKEYEKTPRWFLLSTNLDKPKPWTLKTEIPVFVLALELGKAPERKWLIYAFSPITNVEKLVVEIPNYKKLSISASRKGDYYVVTEHWGITTEIKS